MEKTQVVTDVQSWLFTLESISVYLYSGGGGGGAVKEKGIWPSSKYRCPEVESQGVAAANFAMESELLLNRAEPVFVDF